MHAHPRAILARPPVPWQARIPPHSGVQMRTGAIVMDGTHGFILTPLLLVGTVSCADLKMVTASHTTKLGPNIAESHSRSTPQSA
jgi:hypothetical protein